MKQLLEVYPGISFYRYIYGDSNEVYEIEKLHLTISLEYKAKLAVLQMFSYDSLNSIGK